MASSSQIIETIDALAELVGSENRAAEDEDRGRANRALCVTVFDDGSGRLGRRGAGGGEVEDYRDFGSAEELVALLRGEGVEIED